MCVTPQLPAPCVARRPRLRELEQQNAALQQELAAFDAQVGAPGGEAGRACSRLACAGVHWARSSYLNGAQALRNSSCGEHTTAILTLSASPLAVHSSSMSWRSSRRSTSCCGARRPSTRASCGRSAAAPASRCRRAWHERQARRRLAGSSTEERERLGSLWQSSICCLTHFDCLCVRNSYTWQGFVVPFGSGTGRV